MENSCWILDPHICFGDDNRNYSWDLDSPKSHRVLGRWILLRVSYKGLIVFMTGVWTWPLLWRGSKPEHTTITPVPWKDWGVRLSGNLWEAFQSLHWTLEATCHLLELGKVLQASPSLSPPGAGIALRKLCPFLTLWQAIKLILKILVDWCEEFCWLV